MRTLVCTKCGRAQPSGKFCLDDGAPLKEKITLGVTFKPIQTMRSSESIKKDIRVWLGRIGVQQNEIIITRDDANTASVEYRLLGEIYNLKSWRQKDFSNNLAAIEQLLHYRVLGIERGIEDVKQAFASYAALPAPKTFASMSDSELRELLKKHHPDTGDGDIQLMQQVKDELDRRA